MRYDTHGQLAVDAETMPQHGVYTILRGMNDDIRELKNAHYEYARLTDGRLSRLEDDVSELKRDMQALKGDTEVLKHDVSELKEDVRELRQDLKELHGGLREIAGGMSGMQTRLNWWLVFAGIVIALLQYIKG